jgi:hypothetical protein
MSIPPVLFSIDVVTYPTAGLRRNQAVGKPLKRSR